MPRDIYQQVKNGIRVLLVDDDQESAEQTIALLQRLDSQRNIKHNRVALVSEALVEITHHHYNLILLNTKVADAPTASSIHSLRDAFSYAPIIATMKNVGPEVAAQWIDEGADECLCLGKADETTLKRMVAHALNRYQTFSKLHQQSRIHHVLNTLLSLSLKELPFDQLLKQCLDIILSTPISDMMHQGSILVATNDGRHLQMMAHANLDPRIVELCQKVAFGECLCGHAIETREIQFSTCINDCKEYKLEGLPPHSHYNVPIVSRGHVLGVLALYLQAGHQQSEEETTFLHGVADTLAGIIERARTNDQLTQAHKQNSRLLASLSTILIRIDNQGRISHWNNKAAETFQLDSNQVQGKPIADCSIDWDWQAISDKITPNLMASKQSDYFETRLRQPDGSSRLLSLYATPLNDHRNQIDSYLLIADDITEKRQLELEMHQAQKLQSIGQLAAGIAHEINTPIQYVGDNVRFLHAAFEDVAEIIDHQNVVVEQARTINSVKQHIDQLESKIDELDLTYLQEEIPKSIQQTLDGIERVATIVRAMKEFSHPGSEEKTLTDINKAIESTVTVARNVWKYHAEVTLNLDPALPLIHCIPGPVNEVLLNIIVNAAHAIADKVGESGELGTIEITTETHSDWSVIRIKDSGSGIPESAQQHVFEPFFTTKQVGKGTGQGLSISHKIIVEQHNGQLNFETEPGIGTTFTIKLPITGEPNG
jgi:PAS domain S-box-containing protein